MTYTLSALLLAAATTTAFAQTSGVIQYTETIKMDINIADGDDAIRNLLPKEQKVARVLYFTPEVALYENVSNDEKETVKEYEEGQARMMVRFDMPEEKFYSDLAGKTMLQQRDMMGRKFLIETKTDAAKWKLTGNQTKILGYACQEATMRDGETVVTAWFTSAIPVAAGPNIFGGLPGLILKADMDNGRSVIEATSISLQEVPSALVKKPSQGKKMTRDQFRAMLDERRKEMGAEGGDNVIIKVRR
jgi:GLPGLI family protein